VLNAQGQGQFTFGPTLFGEQWNITNIATSTSTSTASPILFVYRGLVAAANLIASTYDGSSDSDDTHVTLVSGSI